MKAAVIERVNNVVVKDIPIPKIDNETALIKIAYSGFCGPTELCIIEGMHPRAKFPLVLGHEFAGTIEQLNSATNTFKKRDKVTVNPLIFCSECEACRNGNQHICENLMLIGIDCYGGFEEYCLVPIKNLLKLPDSMPLDVAALTEPMAVGVHAVKESGFQIGDNALVFGAGPIGLFVSESLKNAGAKKILICEIDQRRIEFATGLGYEVIRDIAGIENQKVKFSFVFDTSGAEAVLPHLVECAKVKGIICIVGKFDFPGLFNFHDVLFKELKIIGLRVYRENDFEYAIKILANNHKRYKEFITERFNIKDFNNALNMIKQKANLLKVMIDFTS